MGNELPPTRKLGPDAPAGPGEEADTPGTWAYFEKHVRPETERQDREREARAKQGKTGRAEEPAHQDAGSSNIPEKVVTAAAGAIGGALLERAFDAIEDAFERKRVSEDVHARDKQYENDFFKDLSYGQLRRVLRTGSNEGKKLSAEEMVSARLSQRSRLREAESYGVMTGAEGILKQRLIEADWKDYPAKIAEAAKAAEEEASGMLQYRHNPRIKGIVSDVVSDTELTTRRDGYKQMADLNDPANLEAAKRLKITDLSAEIQGLEEEIATKVQWDPINNYAAYVNQETPRQREERLNWEEKERQRQHEVELEKARHGGASDDEMLKKIQEMRGESREWNYDVRRVPPTPEGTDRDAFGEDFVKQLGLPLVIYEIPQSVYQKTVRGYDTATLLTKFFKSGDLLPMFSYQNIMYTLGVDVSDAVVYRAFEGFHKLNNAVAPLVLGRFKAGEGTFYSMVGENGSGGILNKGQGNIDLREIVPAFEKDELAKRALAILLAADGVAEHGPELIDPKTKRIVGNKFQGYEVGGILPDDQAVANDLKPDFKKYMTEKAIKSGRPALNKEPGYSQRECVEYMDGKVARQIAAHLKCDVGRVDLMVMLYTALCGGPRMIEYREIYQRFPVLRETAPCYIEVETGKKTRLIKGDVVMAPLLRKLKVADDAKVISPDTGKKIPAVGMGFGYIERQLALRGVDGLFEALLQMKDGHDLWKFYPAQIFSDMKKVEDMWEGSDSLKDAAARRVEIAKLMDHYAAGDPPQMKPETLAAIKQVPVYDGEGENAEAGEATAFQKEKSAVVEVAKDAAKVARGVFGVTPIGLAIGAINRLRKPKPKNPQQE